MQTAFCSYHERTRVRGRSLTVQSNASLSAKAILMALYASLHWPQSKMRGRPSISPRSRSLMRYLPQASVKMRVSEGVSFAKSV